MSRRPLIALAAVGTGVLLAVLAARIAGRTGDDPIRRSPVDGGTTVMLGDSITAEGDWHDLLPGVTVANEGHPGFTTEQLVDVAARVAAARPRAVFILTGTNDVRDDLPAETTVAGLATILDHFAAEAPDTRVVVQTILPRAATSDAIVTTNQAIRSLVERRELELLDLHPRFDDGRGGLRPGETTDGWHLTDAGYERWVAALAPLIKG